MVKVVIKTTKDEYRRYKSTISNKIKMWTEKGFVLHISGKPKIVRTLNRNLKKKYGLIKPQISQETDDLLCVWFSLVDVPEKNLLHLASFIDSFNKERISILSFDIY